jgi:hypothetical protein
MIEGQPDTEPERVSVGTNFTLPICDKRIRRALQ